MKTRTLEMLGLGPLKNARAGERRQLVNKNVVNKPYPRFEDSRASLDPN